MGRMRKKGVSGAVSNYITRNKALKYLQVTLKDFRRLCILKGIFPREPKKKLQGRGKTYYLRKDIQFLAHEPILGKFREFKTYLKKFTRAKGRKDAEVLERLKQSRPEYTLDHIVKERYPTFVDALRDCDDALCLVHLFAMLPMTYKMRAARIHNCARLAREFQHYVMMTHALRKVFVSIKGIYYQAYVQGQTLTWVVPHTFTQEIPVDVDYRVMGTFVEFYEVLLHFVNYRLYRALLLHYPPKIMANKDTRFFAVDAVQTAKEESEGQQKSAASASSADPSLQKKLATLHKRVVVDSESAENDENMGDDDEAAGASAGDADGADDPDAFQATTAALRAADEPGMGVEPEAKESEPDSDTEAAVPRLRGPTRVFAGMKFLLCRETPVDSLTFVIRSGGGLVVYEPLESASTSARGVSGQSESVSEGATVQRVGRAPIMEDETITHQIMDRPMAGHRFLSRSYVQPQWVYDSFNTGVALPSELYAIGVPLPPHLSPFVKDVDVGYTPAFREYLDKVLEAAENGRPLPPPPAVDALGKQVGENEEGDEGVEDVGEGESEGESDEDEGDQGESGAEDDEASVEGSENEDEATTPTGKRSRAEMEADEEKELAKIMMSKKHKRLYDRMQYGINKKKAANQRLMDKRQSLSSASPAAEKKGPATRSRTKK